MQCGDVRIHVHPITTKSMHPHVYTCLYSTTLPRKGHIIVSFHSTLASGVMLQLSLLPVLHGTCAMIATDTEYTFGDRPEWWLRIPSNPNYSLPTFTTIQHTITELLHSLYMYLEIQRKIACVISPDKEQCS